MRTAGRICFWVVVLGLLCGGAGLSVLRLLQAQRGATIQLVSLTPLAFPAYAIALVLLLAAVRRRGTRRPTRPLLGAGLALVGVVLHGWWIAPVFLGGAPPAAAGARPLVVMTSNLFEGRGDVTDVLAAIKRDGVDVLVLEEISVPALAAADADGLAALLPYRIGGPESYDPVAGTMVLSTRPLGPATPVGTVHDSWLVEVGGAFTVLAVHPVAPVTPEQWRTDHATVREVAERTRPDLVVGDFNATTDHEPMQALNDAGFRDAAVLAGSGWQPTWPANGLSSTGGPLVPPLVRIDHVLVGPAFTALRTTTVDVAGSDHLALVATVARR